MTILRMAPYGKSLGQLPGMRLQARACDANVRVGRYTAGGPRTIIEPSRKQIWTDRPIYRLRLNHFFSIVE